MSRSKSPVIQEQKRGRGSQKNLKQTSLNVFLKQKVESKNNKQTKQNILTNSSLEEDEEQQQQGEDDSQEEEKSQSSEQNNKKGKQSNNSKTKQNKKNNKNENEGISSSNENEEDGDEDEDNEQEPNVQKKRKATLKVKSYKQLNKKNKFNQQDDDIQGDEEIEDMNLDIKDVQQNEEEDEEDQNEHGLEVDEEEVLEKLPRNKKALQKMLEKVEDRLNVYKKQFYQETHDGKTQKSSVGDNAVPICADIRKFDWQQLKDSQMRHGGSMYDVIMMDPPWQLSTSQPSRGVAIAYDSLADELIQTMPIESLQTNGYIFIWAINAKYRITVKIMEKWGYKLIDEVAWVKKTVNGKIAKGHGFYLQHAKESCLIGVKGDVSGPRFQQNIASDMIFSERRGQSQKPTEIYEYAEQLAPNGFYLEVFGRRNNLRSKWVTIGNEI